MAWIESHQSLAHHPKTLRLAKELDCSLPTAVGHLHLLWWWALTYAPRGFIEDSQLDAAECAAKGVDYVRGTRHNSGGTRHYWVAMVHAGFMEREDGGLRIHDWMDYTGRSLEQREMRKESNRLRQSRHRHALRKRGVTESNGPTGPDLTGPNLTPPLPPRDVTRDTSRCYRCQRLEGESPTADCKNATWHTVVAVNGT